MMFNHKIHKNNHEMFKISGRPLIHTLAPPSPLFPANFRNGAPYGKVKYEPNVAEILFKKQLLELNCLRDSYNNYRLQNQNNFKRTPAANYFGRVNKERMPSDSNHYNIDVRNQNRNHLRDATATRRKYFRENDKVLLIPIKENPTPLPGYVFAVPKKTESPSNDLRGGYLKNTRIQKPLLGEKKYVTEISTYSNDLKRSGIKKDKEFNKTASVSSEKNEKNQTNGFLNENPNFYKNSHASKKNLTGEKHNFSEFSQIAEEMHSVPFPYTPNTVSDSWTMGGLVTHPPYKVKEDDTGEGIKIDSNDNKEDDTFKRKLQGTKSKDQISPQLQTNLELKPKPESYLETWQNSLSEILKRLVGVDATTHPERTGRRNEVKTANQILEMPNNFKNNFSKISDFSKNFPFNTSDYLLGNKSSEKLLESLKDNENTTANDKLELLFSLLPIKERLNTTQMQGGDLQKVSTYFKNGDLNSTQNTMQNTIIQKKNEKVLTTAALPEPYRHFINETAYVNKMEDNEKKLQKEMPSSSPPSSNLNLNNRIEFTQKPLKIKSTMSSTDLLTRQQKIVPENESLLHTSTTTIKSVTNDYKSSTKEISLPNSTNSSDEKDQGKLTTVPPISDLFFKDFPAPVTEQKISKLTKGELISLPTQSAKNLNGESNLVTTTSHEFNADSTDFKEFANNPLTFDLLHPPLKSNAVDQEAIWKNGRKMQFDLDSWNILPPHSVAEQRRSDILINDGLDGYEKIENEVSTPSYLNKLKEELSKPDFTVSSIVSTVPLIINDLRGNTISTSDLTILSKAFGKYWPHILTLSKNADVDELLLMRMKDESDLKNVLQNLLPNDLNPYMIIEATKYREDANSNSTYNLAYDYMDEYKDLYGDIAERSVDSPKRKKSRSNGQKKFENDKDNEEEKKNSAPENRTRAKRDEEEEEKSRIKAAREYYESLKKEEQKRVNSIGDNYM